MKAISLLLPFLLIPFVASAQDISVKMDKIPIGSWWVAKSEASSSMHILRKRQGKTFVVDIVDPAKPNGPRLARDIRDGDGNVLKRTEAVGRITVYKPHDCLRVLGRCEYTTKQTGKLVDRQGQTGRFVRTTKAKSNGYVFELLFGPDGQQIHFQSGTVVSLDRFGIVEKARGKSGLRREKKFSLKKVRASWD